MLTRARGRAGCGICQRECSDVTLGCTKCCKYAGRWDRAKEGTPPLPLSPLPFHEGAFDTNHQSRRANQPVVPANLSLPLPFCKKLGFPGSPPFFGQPGGLAAWEASSGREGMSPDRPIPLLGRWSTAANLSGGQSKIAVSQSGRLAGQMGKGSALCGNLVAPGPRLFQTRMLLCRGSCQPSQGPENSSHGAR